MLNINSIVERLKNREPESMEEINHCAILIPLVKIDGEWEIIFELRSKNMSTQPGEVSFPGGKMETNESYKETAVRETVEELNIPKESIDILGELDYLRSYTNLEIHCFLGTISGISVDNISPNPGEVDHIFTVPLKYFLETEPEGYYMDVENTYNAEFPYNLIPGGKDYKFRKLRRTIYFYQYNDYVIWGYTATMIKHLIEIIKDL
ncbi:MAG TPA: CoA pyrophosphatase [Tissierellaceae bacterium]|nr:CoA pyrophosphatase [Tissierellaceae bacterium]